MKRHLYVLALAVLVLSVAAAAGAMPPGNSDANAVARVNGKPITLASLDDRIEQIYPMNNVHGRHGLSTELRQQALDQLIIEELIWQEAVKLGRVTGYADAQREMFRVRRLCGPSDFDAGLRAKGMTRARYTRLLQRKLTLDSAIRQHVDVSGKVTPGEVRTFFTSNRQRFHRPERAHIRLILVAVEPNASLGAEQQAKKKAEGLYALLQAGKDFGEVAWESSDDMYRVKGGDVGWMHKGSMDAEFEPLAFSLPLGTVTPPFRTPPGYSIMKVEGREPAKDMTFDEVREMLTAQLTAKKKKELRQTWEASLKKTARIEVTADAIGMQASVRVSPSH